MPSLEALKHDILTECEEDHVALWSVIRDVEQYLRGEDEAAIRDSTLNVLHDLLLADEITAGFPTADGRSFRPLQIPLEKVLDRIKSDWPVGHRPNMGDGLWFTKAKKLKPPMGGEEMS